MTFDPTAIRSGSVESLSPPYQIAFVAYIHGQYVPAVVAVDTQSAVWTIPTIRVHVAPDVLLFRMGNEDRVPVQVFYLDHWVEPGKPTLRLLAEGEIIGWSYSNSKGSRTISFSCAANIQVFEQLYFQFMTNVDDIVASRSPDMLATTLGATPGLIYPYGLFHTGLLSTGTQVNASSPHNNQVPPANPDDGATGGAKPIQAPYEFVTNLIRGCISSTVPNERRAVPMMNFFARWVRKTGFHNRWVRLPILEDPVNLARGSGVFPIFRAVRSTEALNAMQRHVTSQVGNAGPVWSLLQQTLGLVYMQIGMIPNPCSVIVQLNDTSGGVDETPVDGRILGPPRYDTPIEDQRTVDNQQGDRAPVTVPGAVVPEPPRPPLAPAPFEPDFVPPTPGDGVRFTRGVNGANGLGLGAELGISRLTPIRLAQYFVQPQFTFGIAPACNGIYPSMVISMTYDENYMAQPTRTYVNDAVMTQLLRADGPNREFMLHALTVGFPEEADALLHHKTGAGFTGQGASGPVESGKNLLIYPEEWFKGPVVARAQLPAWFQMLRQFSNSHAAPLSGGVTTGATTSVTGNPTIGDPATGGLAATTVNKAESLMNGAVHAPTGGLAFGVTRSNTIRGGQHFHAGADFAAPLGTEIVAVLDGTVSGVYQNFEAQECGPMVVLKHPGMGPNRENIYCVYMHLNDIDPAIRRGARVRFGQVVGHVGNKNGNRGLQREAVQALGVPAEAVARAVAAPTREAVQAILQPFVDKPTPAGATGWPWNKPWQARANAIAGFMRDSGPHCHFEVVRDIGHGSLRPPRIGADGLPTPNNRIDPAAWLRAIGVSAGTNVRRTGTGARRNRPPVQTATPPAAAEAVNDTDDLPTAVDFTDAQAGNFYQEEPAGSDLLIVRRPTPRTAARVEVEHPGTSPGVPPVTTPATPAPSGDGDAGAPAVGTPQDGDTFARVFRIYVQNEHQRGRYSQRAAGAQLRFNPYLVVGFPAMLFDHMSVGGHVVGYVQSVGQSMAAGPPGHASTSVQLTFCRTFYEFIADVREDAIRFAGRVTAAPAEIVSEIREVVQDEANAEIFYSKLLYGGRPTPAGAALRWTEIMGYADGVQTQPVVIEGDTVAQVEVRLRADNQTHDASAPGAATPPAEGHSATPAPPTGPAPAPETELRTNLDPNREFSPTPQYAPAFDSYDVAMRFAARPCCTLDEFIRFWHGGKPIATLQAEGKVGPACNDLAYALEKVQGTIEGADAAGHQTLTPGLVQRGTATFYDHIFKLRAGPGAPPTAEQRGYTDPPNVVPTAETSGVGADYPESRADWDGPLILYREKWRRNRSPRT